jgi:hypothetical protein
VNEKYAKDQVVLDWLQHKSLFYNFVWGFIDIASFEGIPLSQTLTEINTLFRCTESAVNVIFIQVSYSPLVGFLYHFERFVINRGSFSISAIPHGCRTAQRTPFLVVMQKFNALR